MKRTHRLIPVVMGGASDSVSPTVVITTDEADPTIVSPITYRFTFSEDVTGFATGDITVANGTKVTFATVSASVYTQTVVPDAGATVTVDVAAGVCIDGAGNANTAATQKVTISKVLLWDNFVTARAAGAINGTAAEPGPGGNRTVTDTGSKITITAGGLLDFATGATANDGIWYSSLARAAGKAFIAKIIPANTAGKIGFGWDNGAAGAILDAAIFNATTGLQLVINGGTAFVVGVYSAGTYYIAGIMRATGILWFIKGGTEYTDWTFLYATQAGTAAGVPALTAQNTTSIFTADNIRSLTGVSFAPLISDSFNRDDGAIGNADGAGTEETGGTGAWTGANATILTNKAIITPALGAEYFDAPAAAFTSGTYGWTAYGTNTIANVSNTLEITYVDNAAGALNTLTDAVDLNANLTVNTWCKLQFDSKINTGSAVIQFNGALSPSIDLTSTDFVTHTIVGRTRILGGGNNSINFGALGAGEVAYLDNLSLKQLTLSTCFSSVSTSTSNVHCAVDIVSAASSVTNIHHAGLVVCLDSAASPANFLIAYYDGGNVKLDKCVAGVYTNLISVAVTYVSGARLVVVKSGTAVEVYYNNIKVGTTQTVADAGIVSNVLHGIFSTDASNTFENFAVWARNGYTTLDGYI